MTIIIILINYPFKALLFPCILALFLAQHPIAFNNPTCNQFMSWHQDLYHVLHIFCVHPILPEVTHFAFQLLIHPHVNWLTHVRATARDKLDFDSKSLDFWTTCPIMWTQNKSKMRSGIASGGSVSLHGKRHFSIQSIMTASSIHAFFA